MPSWTHALAHPRWHLVSGPNLDCAGPFPRLAGHDLLSWSRWARCRWRGSHSWRSHERYRRSALASAGPWDAVVDTSGYSPEMVRASASALRPVATHYVYLSTVNAYRGWPNEPLTDDSPVFDTDGVTETVDASHGSSPAYGPLKAACERAAQRQFGPDNCLILRPGVVLGPYEYVGRLPWLLGRMRLDLIRSRSGGYSLLGKAVVQLSGDSASGAASVVNSGGCGSRP